MLLTGTGRTRINPFWGVELTGWGYYIERRWQQVHDDLHATAVAVEGSGGTAILVSLDLMVIDTRFTELTRSIIVKATGLSPSAIMLTCTHTHNAPAAGGLLGVGACDRQYEDWAAHQAATAAILAWNSRQEATVRCATTTLNGVSFNRTRSAGVVDPNLTTALFESSNGAPIVVVTNFAAHPTVCTELRPWDVTRDVPGRVCELLEAEFPGALAVYVQGACGDTNFLREFQTEERCDEPAKHVVRSAVASLQTSEAFSDCVVSANSALAVLPTRRWTQQEIDNDRHEAAQRLKTEDFSGWRETIGRCMTNRPEDMVARHGGDEEKAVRAMCRFQIEWTGRIQQDLLTRPEVLQTEVQSLHIGTLNIVSNSSEFFSPFALDVRSRADTEHLMIACYANGRIGYLPDEHDITAKSYAGCQSPKYCNQFPFVEDSGPVMCKEMLRVIHRR
jgi:neutral ceramidase